jgi:predicted DNA-binding antitoxin AbrB/MazE fold protein
MREQIEVVYENGILRPLGTLSGQFQEHQHLTVTVEDADESTRWLADADPTASLEAITFTLIWSAFVRSRSGLPRASA